MTRIILAAAAVVVLTSCFHEEVVVWVGLPKQTQPLG